MNDPASYATVGFPDVDLGRAVDAIAAAGFNRAEISSDKAHYAALLEAPKLSALSRALRRSGVRAQTLHAPARRNVLGPPDETWRHETLRTMAQYLHCAAELDAPGLVVHPVPNPIFVPDGDHPDLPARIGEAVIRSLDELCPIAQELGVCLLLENLPYQCNYPLLSLRELAAAIDPYPPGAVGLVIDIGHTVLLGDSVDDEILAAGDRLLATHLHDNDGLDDRHWLPTHGAVDWTAVHRALKHIDYVGAWTFEVIAPRNNETPETLCRLARSLASRWQEEMKT